MEPRPGSGKSDGIEASCLVLQVERAFCMREAEVNRIMYEHSMRETMEIERSLNANIRQIHGEALCSRSCCYC